MNMIDKTNDTMNDRKFRGVRYEAPVCTRLELFTEGVLCGNSLYGAGMLKDNSWNITFDEDIAAGAGAGSFEDNVW